MGKFVAKEIMDRYNIDFPLCLNRSVDGKVKECMVFCCDFLFRHFSEKEIEAIILTGSFSRGEGTVFLSSNGSFRPYSDIELMIALSTNVDFRRARKKLHLLSKEISQKLKDNGLFFEVTFGGVNRRYLRRSKPQIFTFELQKYGKIIWGDNDILNEMPPLEKKAIPKKDAINLLFNRMLEQLINYERIQRGEDEEKGDAIYHINKGYLDIAGSVLVFEGQYESGYLKRAGVFQDCFKEIDFPCLDKETKDLAEKVRKAAEFKLNPSLQLMDETAIKENWKDLSDYFRTIWIWESNRYLGMRETDNIEKLIQGYFKKESLMFKFKGWIKLFLHPYLRRGEFSYRRMFRLLFWGSPQNLIYAALTLLYFGVDNLDKVRRLLPIITEEKATKELSEDGLRKAVIYNWSLFVKEG